MHMIEDIYQIVVQSIANVDNGSSNNIQTVEPVIEPLDEKHILKLIDEAILSNGLSFDVAQIIHYIYKNELQYKNKIWHMYDKNEQSWNILNNDATALHNIFNERIKSVFLERAHHFSQLSFQADNPGLKDLFQQRSATSLKIACDCLKAKFRRETISKLKQLYCL
jgi:hypothetical protein